MVHLKFERFGPYFYRHNLRIEPKSRLHLKLYLAEIKDTMTFNVNFNLGREGSLDEW